MNPGPPHSAPAATSRLVTTAFLLGWSVSVTLGYLRRGVRRATKKSIPAADYAPRLVASDGSIDKASDGLILSADRIVQYYKSLAFEPESQVSPLTQKIYELPPEIYAWLAGASEKFYPARELRELLNAWSLQVWARLDAASADSARAFTAGLSLADTYWYQRPPFRRPKITPDNQLSEENWRRLLSPFRLTVARRRLSTLADYLPPYVVAVISHHLQWWSIGCALGYENDRLAYIPDCKQTAPLKPEDEQKLQDALARQMQNWETMLFGLREATSYLHPRDIFLIDASRRLGLFITLLIVALGLVGITVEVGYLFATTWLPVALQVLNQRQAGVSDWLGIVSFLWTILIAAPVPFVLRSLFQATRSIQLWLDDTLKVYFIAQRTYVPWDRYMDKSQMSDDSRQTTVGRKQNAGGGR